MQSGELKAIKPENMKRMDGPEGSELEEGEWKQRQKACALHLNWQPQVAQRLAFMRVHLGAVWQWLRLWLTFYICPLTHVLSQCEVC